MDLRDLVRALMQHDARTARQWVAEYGRQWSETPRPDGLSGGELSVAAGVVELLASRVGVVPPTWTEAVGASPEPIWLIRIERRPRLRQRLLTESPAPLLRRQIFAPEDFLSAA
jgi:hypothetical protein